MKKIARDLPDDLKDRILTFHQAAKLRGTSVDTVRRSVKCGDLQAVKLSARRVGIWLSEAMRTTAT